MVAKRAGKRTSEQQCKRAIGNRFIGFVPIVNKNGVGLGGGSSLQLSCLRARRYRNRKRFAVSVVGELSFAQLGLPQPLLFREGRKSSSIVVVVIFWNVGGGKVMCLRGKINGFCY